MVKRGRVVRCVVCRRPINNGAYVVRRNGDYAVALHLGCDRKVKVINKKRET